MTPPIPARERGSEPRTCTDCTALCGICPVPSRRVPWPSTTASDSHAAHPPELRGGEAMLDTNRPVPPGVTEDALDRALAAIAAAIGDDKVATDAESLADFQDPFQFPGSARNVPC